MKKWISGWMTAAVFAAMTFSGPAAAAESCCKPQAPCCKEQSYCRKADKSCCKPGAECCANGTCENKNSKEKK
jgi:hypothetical protein